MASAARRSAAEGEPAARSVWSGVLVGIGVAGFIDEAVFHQILHWHHFYDRSTPSAGLVSDGLFHAVSWFAVVGGLYLLAHLRRIDALEGMRWWSGMLLGSGGFQLYDGTIQHKLMNLHQIRYHHTIWPYDLAWNLVAVAALVAGVLLHRRAGRR
jgi:uncharacterized membrane protein